MRGRIAIEAVTTCVLIFVLVSHGYDACQSGRFGRSCELNCHCTGTCNNTGHCSTTCDTGWSGPTCQIIQGENVALHKKAFQHDTNNADEQLYKAGYAVDGNLSTYAHSKRSNGTGYAWWKVDLGQRYNLSRIHISFQTWPSRERDTWMRIFGFSVAFSSQKHYHPVNEDQICFRDQWQSQGYSPLEYTLDNCSYNAQYVSIYNIRNDSQSAVFSRDAHIMLREVKVYRDAGCADGTYGSRCEHVCGHCVGKTCERETGHCSSRTCKPDWTGDSCASPATSTAAPCHCKGGCIAPLKCNECEAGWFGDSCEVPCPQNCSQEGCGKDTGNCRSCVDGIYVESKITSSSRSSNVDVIAGGISGGLVFCVIVVLSTLFIVRKLKHRCNAVNDDLQMRDHPDATYNEIDQAQQESSLPMMTNEESGDNVNTDLPEAGDYVNTDLPEADRTSHTSQMSTYYEQVI